MIGQGPPPRAKPAAARAHLAAKRESHIAPSCHCKAVAVAARIAVTAAAAAAAATATAHE